MEPFLLISVYIAFALLIAAMCFTFYRLIKGPDTSNRIAAMDLMASVTMGIILVYSILINQALYFDIAIIISLVSFIGTIAIATYIKHKK
ncbi:MAG: hypothetical protein JXB00_08885 [Bacteroidales bacterium]|nr:hypothetical protein [Bacteroidales bacterium]